MSDNYVIGSFVKKLDAIGIHVELVGNYPWIYLDKVNGVKVKGTFWANHGFTVFLSGEETKFTDRRVVFDKIRETLYEEENTGS